MHRHGFVISLALIAATTSLSFSQTTASPAPGTVATMKAKARLVLVDVVVTNDKGDPVTGLQKSDFEVLEDGKPQSIATFEEHRGAPVSQILLPPLPPHVYTNFPLVQSADSVNVILLDALNTPARDQVYVRAQMLKYLRKIPPGTRVAVFTLASRLRMLQGVTTDSTQLLAALNMTGPQRSPLLPSDNENEANDQFVKFLEQEEMGAAPQTRDLAAVNSVEVAKQFLADTASFETQQRVEITLEAMQQLARYLADVPGRKNVIWFSGSFPTGIFADPDLPDSFNIVRTFEDEVRKTTDLLSSAQLALYPVAAEGLASDAIYQANGQEIGEKRPSMAIQDQLKQMQNGETSRDLNHGTMEDLAKDTGGRAYYNTNGLDDALARVVSNGSRYYSLAYSPSNSAMDGKFRRIQVKLVSGKENLAYRRGYYADDLATELGSGQGPGSDPLLPLMGRNLPDYSQILYKVLVQPANPQPAPDAPRIGSNPAMKGPFTRYSVDFAISAKDVNLEAGPDGVHRGRIEVALLAYSREGKPLNFVVMQANVAVESRDFEAIRRSGLPIHKEIDVPDGYAFLRTGVYDLKLNSAGTLGIPLTDTVSKAAR